MKSKKKIRQTTASVFIDIALSKMKRKYHDKFGDIVLPIEEFIRDAITNNSYEYEREFKIIRIDFKSPFLKIAKNSKVDLEFKIDEVIAPHVCTLITFDTESDLLITGIRIK